MFEEDFKRVDFVSEKDGARDWYLVHVGKAGAPCVVVLHGHGSFGDQILVRPDKVKLWTAFLLKENFHVISPNIRGNSWMSEAAQADLIQILNREKTHLNWSKLLVVGGSMGASSALIFAVRHPEAVDGIGVLGAMTDPASYLKWLEAQPLPGDSGNPRWLSAVMREIRQALLASFPAEADQTRNSALWNAEKLFRMPVRYWHGTADQLIPYSQAESFCEKMKNAPDFKFRSIPGGDHDSPLPCFAQAVTELLDSLR